MQSSTTGEKCQTSKKSDKEILSDRENPSRLPIPLTNISLNDSYTVHGCILKYGGAVNSQTQLGFNFTWDGCLDVTTAPELGVEGQQHLESFGKQRKRLQSDKKEDLAYTEYSNINYDHQQTIKKRR